MRAVRAVRGVLGVIAFAGLASSACAARAVPDPRDAARAYGEAAARGDAGALYAMMSASSRRDRSQDDVARILSTERAELSEQGSALSQPGAHATATARLRYADGEEAALDMRDGGFWVTAAGALPGGGRTPGEALDQSLREAEILARIRYEYLCAATRGDD